jgi:hypothetical protein
MVAPRALPDWVSAILSSFNARLIYFFRIFLHPRDITFQRLMKATKHFGYNPRLCFSDSHSETALSEKIRGVQGRIERLALDAHAFLSRLNSYREGQLDGDQVSHTIFRLSPTADSLLGSCRYDIVSKWALERLLSTCQARQKDAALAFYCLLRPDDPLVAPLRGHLFEKAVLSH